MIGRGGYANGGYQPSRPKKERKLTFVSRSCPDSQHCSGVNSLELSRDGACLFSAGRDSTIKRWGLKTPGPTFECSLEGHTDWVNDVALLDNTLLSCSSDTTVKVWRGNTGECLRTFARHSDYVTSLVVAPLARKFISGGLGGEVFIWDLESALGVSDGIRFNEGQPPLEANGHKESVYSLAVNETATMMVSGSTECSLRVWDPRTGVKQFKLKGHTSNVKALVLDASGRRCLSGSSDNTVRLWDLGQQRCVQTFAMHQDSVWALAVDPSFTKVYSGGRDKQVFVTDLHTRSSVLLFKEEEPILKLCLEPEATGGDVWAATNSSSIHKWFSPVMEADDPSSGKGGGGWGARMFSPGTSPYNQGRAPRLSTAPHFLPPPVQSTPTATIPGAPSIVQHTILNNRLHVLVQYSSGAVALWDVTRGEAVARYGNVSFKEKEEELQEQVSMASWFTLDTRLGSISVTLEPPSCFSAEMYAIDLNVAGASDELKVNLGEQVL
eukprot:CAMPEP_0118930588 /NCGR_PEP_ID=MMETSP1169-20130426/7222_1 /TAXON_ID=36882 /ORGANISM="Pyramimonas obovata, Strain CCMP722" /LENGTH=495 /DNA_ID=CAMNT_0006872965 /DNA_START=141 /DNA_END=1624 /DNA_ORIENTATION=+